MTALAQRPLSRFDPAAPPPPPLLTQLSTSNAWLIGVAVSGFLGIIMSKSAVVSTAHMWGTLATVIAIALVAKRPDAIVAVTVYAGMCDVLWRSTGAHGPYEASKLAIIFGLGVLVVRFVKRPRNMVITTSIVVLLIPGAVIGVFALGLARGRMEVSSNLSGLVAVCVAVLACSNLRLTQREIRGAYLCALAPVVSLCAHATLGTIQTKVLDFSDKANFDTSGGFGPNQVSSALCLGGLLCILVMIQPRLGTHFRVLALIIAGWLVGQAVLTFSRGGLFALVLSGIAIALAALTASGQRTRVLVAAAVLSGVALKLLSWAGAFTGGASKSRLSSTDSTNRTRIALGDLRLFRDRPLFGVGVGESQFVRDLPAAPHTEYTRLLAEHGFFGVVVIGVLITLCIRLIRTARGWYRLAAVGLIVMALAQMTHSATRIGSIAVAFGLAAFLEESD